MEPALGRISAESAREATGRGWDEWLEELDGAGAAALGHKEIIAYLERHHPDVSSGWWRQSVTVGYERGRGKRAVSETAGAAPAFRSASSEASPPPWGRCVWEVITSRSELWLGAGASVAFTQGEQYEGPRGEAALAVRAARCESRSPANACE